MHAVFNRKTSDNLADMTGNSCQVILPREMVQLVLVNAATNRNVHSSRCLPNALQAMLFKGGSYQGLVHNTER